MANKILSIDDLRMVTFTGTVVGSQVWSETHVHGGSHGGSPYVGPNGGHVSTPTVSISSSTTEKLHLFIRRDDGKEFDQRFVHAGVGVRDGARVSIVYVPDEQGEPMALVNHDTGKSRVYENRISGLLGKPPSSPLLGAISFIYMLSLLPLFLFLIYWGLTGHLSFLGWLGWNALLLAGMPVLAMLAPKHAKGLVAGVREALHRSVAEVLTQERAASANP